MKALIFDMDGLMIDSERLYFETERELARRYQKEVKDETLWKMMGRNPIEDIATIQDGNYGRYDNQEVFDLTDQLDQTPTDDLEGMQAIISELQRIYLTDMPLIPLWYNGAWSQYSNNVWTNWPSSEEGSNHYFPVSWRGYWNMTGILMLCEVEPAATE